MVIGCYWLPLMVIGCFSSEASISGGRQLGAGVIKCAVPCVINLIDHLELGWAGVIIHATEHFELWDRDHWWAKMCCHLTSCILVGRSRRHAITKWPEQDISLDVLSFHIVQRDICGKIKKNVLGQTSNCAAKEPKKGPKRIREEFAHIPEDSPSIVSLPLAMYYAISRSPEQDIS